MKELKYECGACVFWSRADQVKGVVTVGQRPMGVCYGAPPGVTIRYVNGQPAGQANTRPQTFDTERACGLFTPLELLPDGANSKDN